MTTIFKALEIIKNVSDRIDAVEPRMVLEFSGERSFRQFEYCILQDLRKESIHLYPDKLPIGGFKSFKWMGIELVLSIRR